MTMSQRLFVVIVWLSCALVLFANAVTSMTTRDYVNFRFTETRHLLLDAYNTDDEPAKWKNLWSRAASQPPRTLNFFDEMYMIDEPQQQVATAVVLNIDGANNNARDARRHQLNLPSLASPNEAIEFVKSYLWNGLSFWIVCRMSYCTHYSDALDDAWTFENPQLIEYPTGQRAIDAAYFAHAGQAHLVIAYRANESSTTSPSSKLYQWNGTRMARLDGEIPVAAPKSVITFESLHESTVILFIIEQSADASPQPPSTRCAIYEFDERSLLREIRSPTNNRLLDAVVSVYPYNYASQQLFLTIDRMGLADILLWNGTGFEKLINLPDIQAFDQIRLAQIDNHILLFISDLNALHVYKIEGTKVQHLNDLAMVNKQRLIEITAWKYDDTIMLLLIKINADGTFQTELWQMSLEVKHSDNDAWTCLRQLKDALDARTTAIRDFEISQSKDLSNLNNSRETFPLHLSDLIVNDGSVSVVEFRKVGDNAKVANPQHVKEKLLQLQENTRELENDMIGKNSATLSGNVSIYGDAYIDELLADDLQADYINGELADFENYLISGMDQRFAKALNVKLISIEDLSVNSLCGSSFDHWMRVNDSVRSNFAHLINAHNSRVVDDDTIVIESELIMEELHTKNLNGIEFNGFLENVFRIGKEQTIRGELNYEGIVQVMRLYAERVNNVSSSDLITKPNNQSLHEVFIDTLEVEQLFVRKINGVPIDNAAIMSQQNFIKGKVTLSNLIITDELTVNENLAIPLTHSTQVYDDIYIDGDLFIKNLDFEDHTSLNISGSSLAASINSLVQGSWSRSGNQTIPGPIAFQKGASIDRLECLYLNALTEQDFLYTDSTELRDLENVTFGNFHFNAVCAESSEMPSESFVRETNDYVTFYKPVRMRYLSVERLFADKYNGIPIESVMRPNDLLELADAFEFETVRVDGQMRVDDLRLIRLNRKNSQPLGQTLRIDQNFALNSLSGSNVSFTNLNVSKLNGRDFEAGLAAQESFALYNGTKSMTKLTIDAEVRIEGNLHVDRINNEQASNYTSRLPSLDASELIQIKNIGSLTVMENFEVALLNGQKITEFFAGALSRSKRQTLSGELKLDTARINYLTADAINGVDLSKLMYSDRAATLHNVEFSNLRVLGDIKSRTFNGLNASELARKLQRLPIGSVDNLLVQGDVDWHESSDSQHSLSRLLDNAVTKHQDQRLASPITFYGSVVVESLYLPESSSEISQKIREIIDDTLIDNVHSNAITLKGTKAFKHGLTVGNLEVDGNIDIGNVNGLDIGQVSLQIFQKDKPQVVTADMTFLNNVHVARLLTHNPIHRVHLQQLAVIGQTMPKKLHFQQLRVDGDVSLYKLDGIDFDEFVKGRVTTDNDNEIFSDVEFLHSVDVSNATYAASVNEIMPENLVQNNADGAPIMIHGNKIFNSELVVQQNLETAVINDFQVSSVYDNAILNETNAAIHGNLVFEGDVEIWGNITFSGEINGLPLQRFSEIKYLQNRLALNTLSKGLSLLNTSLSETAAAQSRAFDVLYLEEENKLNWHFSRVHRLKIRPAKSKTRLEIVTSESHEVCGLQDGCLCRKQFVVDLLPSGEYEIQEQSLNNLTYTFYPAEGAYGLKIISKSTSYSEQCSRAIDAHESSKVFWFKLQQSREILRRNPALVINDYISDAQVFQFDGQLYLIVAIFYNRETKSHATNSLLYQFDLNNGKALLVQTIATNGAKSIDLFQIPNAGMHVLIGCVKGKAESLLLRFNPTTYQFQMIRTFATGGSKYVASVSSDDKSFVILDNPDVRALQIFDYDESYDNFVDYQNIFFESRVTSLAVFYSGEDFKHSDAFVVTTTKDGWLYIYEYMFYGKFQLKISHCANDIQVLTPFRHMNKNYLFAGFKFNSTVYKVIQQGYY